MTRIPNYHPIRPNKYANTAPINLSDALSKSILILNRIDEIVEECEMFVDYALEDGFYDGCPPEYWNGKIEAYKRCQRMIEGRLFPVEGPNPPYMGG